MSIFATVNRDQRGNPPRSRGYMLDAASATREDLAVLQLECFLRGIFHLRSIFMFRNSLNKHKSISTDIPNINHKAPQGARETISHRQQLILQISKTNTLAPVRADVFFLGILNNRRRVKSALHSASFSSSDN